MSKDEIKKVLGELENRKELYDALKKEFDNNPTQTQISITDGDSKLMKFPKGALDVGYNIQKMQ
jgi:hypothetical protein